MLRSQDGSINADNHVSLFDIYNFYFEVVSADTPELLEQAHRLRYQVYCVENEFEDATENADGLETDDFDVRSKHSLLIHRASGTVAGTVRLILPDNGGSIALPAVDTSDALRERAQGYLPPDGTAEISRFSISKDFRRRMEDGHWPAIYGDSADSTTINRRILPHITLGLMRAIVTMSVENGVTHWCASVETPLLRLLKRLGINFQSVGPLVNYHGWRQPVYNSVSDVLNGIHATRPEVWDVITSKGELFPPPAESDFQKQYALSKAG